MICLGIFGIMFAISRWGNIRMKSIRKAKRDVSIQMDRSMIRIIMSKFEILQNTKIVKEITTISDQIKQLIHRDVEESK